MGICVACQIIWTLLYKLEVVSALNKSPFRIFCFLSFILIFVLQERSLTLDQPVKIGRSVARARAAPNNAIFDCKVLSRNHALLWYENGKVLIKLNYYANLDIHSFVCLYPL